MGVTKESRGLYEVQELSHFLKVDRWGGAGSAISKALLRLTKLDKLNAAYSERANLSGLEMIDSMFEYLGIDYTVFEKDLARIPQEGPFVVIANHPLGGIDGMILMKILLERRSDFKMMGNFLLDRVHPLRPHLLQVNPFEDYKNVRSSYAGIKSALLHLRAGHPIGIFPAGEVSTRQNNGIISDRAWPMEAMKFIKKANVPVIPFYFHAKNSKPFYFLSNFSGTLRTAMLPREMTTQNKRKITLRIGHPIEVEKLNTYTDIKSFTDYLRGKTYLLSRGIHNHQQNDGHDHAQDIYPEVSQELLCKDVAYCRNNQKLLFKSNAFEVFVAYKKEIPNIVTEIGRQREIVFRAIGEGTQKALDLDRFDEYYQHLFIFDAINKKIVGAYRMGIGKDIYPKYGLQGFYLNELFAFDKEVHHILSEGIELGRAFLAKDYQRKPMSLFLLWKGILMSLIKEDLKYLIGGVSISDAYSSFSKSVIIDFLQSNHFDHEVAQHVKARQPFKVTFQNDEKEFVHSLTQNDMSKIDKLIDEIEPYTGMKLPVLLKKYIKQNTKLIAFNVDPQFNDALDGLMYVDIDKIPARTLQSAIKEYQEFMNHQNRNVH